MLKMQGNARRGQNIRWSYNMEGNTSLSVDETEKDLEIWISSDMKCSDQCFICI